MATKAMVLAAGHGTRLAPITSRIPKPLVPIANVPLLRWNLALIRNAGIREIAINVFHLGAQIDQAAHAIASELELSIVVSNEKKLLGTGGGIRGGTDLLNIDSTDTLVVINGDVLFDVDLLQLLAAHHRSGAPATMALMPMPEGEKYGAVLCDREMQVRAIAGFDENTPRELTRWHFTGVHVLTANALARLRPGVACDINRTLYPALAVEGTPAHGHQTTGYWNDIGTPRRLLEANIDVLSGRVPLARFQPWCKPIALATSATVDPTAQIDSQSVIGEGSVIEARSVVLRSLIFSRTDIASGERLERTIALGDLRVPVPGGVQF